VWHASISRPEQRPRPTERWTKQERNEVQRLARTLLDGVGQAPEEAEFYPLAYHVRRCLTDAEIASIDPAWVALPALDEGGTPEEVRAMLIARGILR
jgi:hypothetical protein